MSRFRQALLDELVSRVGDPVPARRTARLRRPRLAFGGVALAAAAAAAAVVVAQGSGTPAYAVTTEPDGTVSVTVNRVDDPRAANQQLRAAGAWVVIMRPSAEEDCPVADRGEAVVPNKALAASITKNKNRNMLRVRPDVLPAGAVLVVAPVKPFGGKGSPELALVGGYAAPGPKCVINPLPF